MRIIFYLFITLCFLYGCGPSAPDVSNIKVDLSLSRFEKDLFEGDSTKQLFFTIQQKYPEFGSLFLERIIGAEPTWPIDSTINYINNFKRVFKPVYDTSKLLFKDFDKPMADIKKTLQYAKYYFPNQLMPNKVITYVGPLDGYGDIIAENVMAIGLHHHFDSSSTFYQASEFQAVYPQYVSKFFRPDFIDINLAKNLLNGYFPENLDDKTLIEQMVEKGKRIYAISLLTPNHPPQDWISYTQKQYDDCIEREKNIWNFFTQNNYLQTTEKMKVRNFIGESPKTQELGEAAPGNIGSFIGWQIVKQYMKSNSNISLTTLMQTEANKIIEETKYKP